MLPLSKTLDPADFDELAPELRIVDQHFTSALEQHPMRRWEYALALRALKTWAEAQDPPGPARRAYDIGGAGSPFAAMAGTIVRSRPEIIDPAEKRTGTACRLQEFVRCLPSLADVVFCLSVLEHVDDLDRFLYHLSCLVAPGGLLVLTMDYADQPVDDWPEDHYHFSWMRKRIFNQYGWRLGVGGDLVNRDFSFFGPVDWTDHGPRVFDYSFCSLTLVKRP